MMVVQVGGIGHRSERQVELQSQQHREQARVMVRLPSLIRLTASPVQVGEMAA